MAYSPRPTSTPVEGTQHTVINATRARQGRSGKQMFWVLMASTLLAALGLFLAWAWKAHDLAATNVSNGPAKSGPAFHAPQPAAPTPPTQP